MLFTHRFCKNVGEIMDIALYITTSIITLVCINFFKKRKCLISMRFYIFAYAKHQKHHIRLWQRDFSS